jgi:hypothetical protein
MFEVKELRLKKIREMFKNTILNWIHDKKLIS